MPSNGFHAVFITDIGSTTTKGLLLRGGSSYEVRGAATVPTTVEAPQENVCEGVRAAARALGEHTGEELLDEHGNPRFPYLTTSSAGGGLQMMVVGLTSTDTGKIAQLTAQGAGGVVLRTFTVDDRLSTVERMAVMRDLRPDLILMAGGVDGGDIANLVRLAETLSLAHPRPKFDTSGRIPLVFCGNAAARAYVQQVTAEHFEVHVVDNVRPTLHETNPQPAKDAILDIFMHTVMERAPGYGQLKPWVAADIIPTPLAVERILTRYARRHSQNIVMFDMGGATTDVFSWIRGSCQRTVAANIGMSYSICNVIATAGVGEILPHVPGVSEGDLRDYAAGKMLNPTYIPSDETEEAIERAIGLAGIAQAWKQHKIMAFSEARIGMAERILKRSAVDRFQETLTPVGSSSRFRISDIDLVIAAGGIFSHASDKEVLRIVEDGFLPTGVTKIAVDGSFWSPHCGILASRDEAGALEFFERQCLREIAWVVAPTGAMNSTRVVVSAVDRRSGKTYRLRGNEVMLAPPGHWEVTPAPGISLYRKGGHVVLDSSLPVLFDCRGRGVGFCGSPLIASEAWEFPTSPRRPALGLVRPSAAPKKGPFTIVRELPYDGEILVSEGERVTPERVVGQNTLAPPRVFIVNIPQLVGYHRTLSSEALREGLLVQEGDTVAVGQRVFRGREPLLRVEFFCISPVRGRVVRIEEGGLIILREIQEHTTEPVTIDVAKILGTRPKRILHMLKVALGEFLWEGQEIVGGTGGRPAVRAPISGRIAAIDLEQGTVVMQCDTEPRACRALVYGTVERVEQTRAATIAGEGEVLAGAIGFGRETWGVLQLHGKTPRFSRDVIVATLEPADSAFLRRCVEEGARGIIAPSVDSMTWREFSGRELAVGVTGDEDLPLAVILTEGFGRVGMNPRYREFLPRLEGRIATLFPRTQIRAGVIRPKAIFSE
ncbi:glutamate mutase L [Candidatus Fermentibacteria bacterium]|nr:glutamate mutase L [Candidatus Fermentibacteria bacterium]